jgi:hypothetical protein
MIYNCEFFIYPILINVPKRAFEDALLLHAYSSSSGVLLITQGYFQQLESRNKEILPKNVAKTSACLIDEKPKSLAKLMKSHAAVFIPDMNR